MKHLISAFLVIVIIVSCVFTCSVNVFSKYEPNTSADTINKLTDDLLNYRMSSVGVSSLQALLDGELAANAGNGSEWYVLALSRYATSLDYTYYANMLEYNLAHNVPSGAVARLRCALALVACGRGSCDFVTHTADEAIGQMGIISYIFGLHLLNNGILSSVCTREQIISILLSMQCSDGGWALNGNVGDVDVTSMVIQSLSLSYDLNAAVNAAIDEGISFLSDVQLADGGFTAYGSPNPESSAQVIIALTSLGIDPTIDSRFIKNGKTPLDAMLVYRLNEGGFSHNTDGTVNSAATAQALCALVALNMYRSGNGYFYIFSGNVRSDTPGHDVVPSTTNIVNENQGTTVSKRSSYKLAVAIIFIIVLLICLFVLHIRGRCNRKNIIFSVIICLFAVLAVFLTDIRLPGDYYGSDMPEKTDVVGSVTLTIRCDSVAGFTENSHTPSDGIILDKTVFTISKHESVYDILIEAARKHSIHIEYKGSALGGKYISAIGNIYEHDFGDLSGWMYNVNGISPSVGCDAFILTDGDEIEWFYSRDILRGEAATTATTADGGYQ